MTYRLTYRETASLDESQHDQVITAIQNWVDNAPVGETRRFPFYQRHNEKGETEIIVILSGVDYSDEPAKKEEIRDGLNRLPGDWPDPTDNTPSTPE